MKNIRITLLLFLLFCSLYQNEVDSIPDFILGDFKDDYGITYSISDSVFLLEDHTIIRILEWNVDEQFFVGQNDSSNIYDPLLYSRIDWMKFEGMGEFEWGFCMSAYNEISLDSAKAVDTANRDIPKTGCSDNPFSRMKRVSN